MYGLLRIKSKSLYLFHWHQWENLYLLVDSSSSRSALCGCAILYSCRYGFVVLVTGCQSMYGKYSGHRFYSQNRALRLLLVFPHIRMDVHMNIYYPVTFFDILGILSASCVPLLPFRNTICCSRLFHALSQVPTNTRILTSVSLRPNFLKTKPG